MKLKLKTKYKNVVVANGLVRDINTNDMLESRYEYYYNNGFSYLFTQVKEKDKDDSIK